MEDNVKVHPKIIEVVYLITLGISMVLGLAHFSFPYIFQWYSYVPGIPETLQTSIDYVNFFFSLLLSGVSLICIIQIKEFFKGEKSIKLIYMLLIVTWLSRVLLTIVLPTSSPENGTFWIEIILSTLVLAGLLMPWIYKTKDD